MSILNIFNKSKANEKKKTMFNIVSKSFKYGNHNITLETGKIARQADGAVIAKMGDTVVLATVVCAKTDVNQDFFPLSVHYQEKYSAAGKIPGGFVKRESKPSTRETLISRLIDRSIRPLFPSTYKNEVQVIVTTYSYDKNFSPDIVGIIATSAALSISGIPFDGPVGAARVGFTDGKYTLSLPNETNLDLVVSGTKDGILMVESEAQQLTEAEMLEAVKFGWNSFQNTIKSIVEFKEEVLKNIEQSEIIEDTDAVNLRNTNYTIIKELIESNFLNEYEKAFDIKDKLKRQDAIENVHGNITKLIEEKFSEDETMLNSALSLQNELQHTIESEIVRSRIMSGKKRIDGRKVDEIRPIECEVGILPRAHGSALFTRGETQALVTVTLGNTDEGQSYDDITGAGDEKFMLHYNFPPFSVGEIGRMGSPGRREIGHGKLAWRANHPCLPNEDEFPYVIRVVSDITESNGSSSMATTCGASLAMMDAGVPVSAPVAGIAMGLIKEGDNYKILSDIMGDEDHLGDMDFKVAGTKDGITSLQMDLKITSITFEIMEHALAQAKDGRIHILKKMASAIKAPKKVLSPYAPQMDTSLKIKADQIKVLIGSGGANIRELTTKTNTKIDIKQTGELTICGNVSDIEKAKEEIKKLFSDPEIGQVYSGEIVGLKDFGVFVNLNANYDGMLHISEISKIVGRKVSHPSDIFNMGDTITVEITNIDKKGKIQLSWKK